MKKWNSPEIQVLNINETKNGCWDFIFEFCCLTNDSLLSGCPEQPTTEPVGPTSTPSDEDPTEQFS